MNVSISVAILLTGKNEHLLSQLKNRIVCQCCTDLFTVQPSWKPCAKENSRKRFEPLRIRRTNHSVALLYHQHSDWPLYNQSIIDGFNEIEIGFELKGIIAVKILISRETMRLLENFCWIKDSLFGIFNTYTINICCQPLTVFSGKNNWNIV